MITRQQLEIINRKTLKYPLHIAEKDYFLTLILHSITTSPLSKTLVFKGGTAIHHCYLKQLRFSEDLDFSSLKSDIKVEEIRKIFDSQNFLSIKKEYVSKATIKIEKLQYKGILDTPNHVKVEIDYLQNVLLTPLKKPYHNVWGLDFSVQVMDLKEICAEKIRAMSDRARFRDFFDLYLILKTESINTNKIIDFVKKKEIRKEISKQRVFDNWKVVKTQKQAEMNQVHYAYPFDNKDIEQMINILPFTLIKKQS